jgi:hypothetical protein
MIDVKSASKEKPAPAGLASGSINLWIANDHMLSRLKIIPHSPAAFARRTTIRFGEGIHKAQPIQMLASCQEIREGIRSVIQQSI